MTASHRNIWKVNNNNCYKKFLSAKTFIKIFNNVFLLAFVNMT